MLSKVEILVQNLNFYLKFQFFIKNSTFNQTSKFLSNSILQNKMLGQQLFLVKNRKFSPKSKFYHERKVFVQKIEILRSKNSPSLVEHFRQQQESLNELRQPAVDPIRQFPTSSPISDQKPESDQNTGIDRKKPRIEEKRSYRIDDLLDESKNKNSFLPIITSTPIKSNHTKDGEYTMDQKFNLRNSGQRSKFL